MAQVNRISNQEATNQVKLPDLFLISQSQNAPYNTMWKSKKLTFNDLASSVEAKFRDDNFKDDLDVLENINMTYLNSANLGIQLVRVGNSPKIQLLSAGTMFSELDASLFIKFGLIKNASVVTKDGNKYLELEFFIGSGSETKTVDIPLNELVDTYYAGNGLCCTNNTFRIDTTVVSTIGHHHTSADIDNFPTKVSQFENDAGYLQKVGFNDLTSTPDTVSGYGISDTYTKDETDNLLSGKSAVGHTHAFKFIASKPTSLSGYGIEDAYTVDEINELLDDKSDVEHIHTFAELSAKPTTIAGYGISDAVSKQYVDDEIRKIDIPVVHNPTITIKHGNDIIGKFTLNQENDYIAIIPKSAEGKTYLAGKGLSLDDATNTFSVDSTIARVSQLPKVAKFRDWTIK